MAVAETIQRSIHRALTGDQRLSIAADMSLAARELFLARLRQQHPQWSNRRLVAEWVRQVHGVDLADRGMR
jgi:hypothetical protein